MASALPETQIWDADDLRLLRTLPEGARAFTALAQRDVIYSSDGSLLGAGYGIATLWATSTWRPKISLAAPIATDPRRFGVQSLVFSSEDRRVIIAYSTLAPQKTPPIVAYNTDDGSVAWKYILKPTIGGIPRITTGLLRIGHSDRIAFGTFEVVGGPYRDTQRFSRVVILNADTGSLIRTIDNPHADLITAMAVSDDGRRIATGTATGEIVKTYNLATKAVEVLNNRDPIKIWDPTTGLLLKQLPVKRLVIALGFAPGGSYLFTVEPYSPWRDSIDVWNMTTDSVVQSQPAPPAAAQIKALSMNITGTRLVAVGTGIAVYRYVAGK